MAVYNNAICKSTHFHLRDIGIVGNMITISFAGQLVQALIASRLDFCNSILYNLPINERRLQRMQNQKARILTRSFQRILLLLF